MFRFRLDTILRYRSQLEESEKRELGKIRQELSLSCDKKQQFIDSALQSGLEIDKKKQAGLMSPNDFLLHYNFLEGMEREVHKKNLEIQEIEERVEKQRVKVVEAMKKRQVLSTLRSHGYDEYRIEERKKEQGFIDEIVTSHWNKEL